MAGTDSADVGPVKVGVHAFATPPAGLLSLQLGTARLAGLDSFFVEDHLQQFMPTALWGPESTWTYRPGSSPHELYEPMALLGSLAHRAGGVALGVAVTDPLRRHPVVLAQGAITLAHLTKRAPVLGLGSGEHANLDPIGLGVDHPVARLEEALAVIRLCLSTPGPLDFEGRYYRLKGARMDLRAPQGRTPQVWLAAHGPRMLRLTGQYADGWYPISINTPDEYATKLTVVRAAAKEAGRDPSSITPALLRFTYLASTDDEARAMLDTQFARLFTLLMPAGLWRQHGVPHPLGDDHRGYIDFDPERYDLDALHAALAAAPDSLLRESFLWGTPATVAEKIRQFARAGLRHVVLSPVSSALSRSASLTTARGVRALVRMLRRP